MIHQSQTGECGLACLAMISSYYGHKTDLLELRRRFGNSGKGNNLASIVKMAAQMKLIARPLSLELKELGALKLPAILHWEFNHFVVLKSLGRRRFTIYNPATGISKHSLKEMDRCFTGVALELVPVSDFEKQDSSSRLKLLDLIKLSPQLLVSLVKLVLLAVVVQILILSSPLYLQLVIDEVLVKQDHELLFILACGFGGLFLISMITQVLRNLASLYLTSQLSYSVGSALFHHLIRLPLSYFETRQMGDIVSRFGSIQPIQSYLTGSSVTLIINSLMIVGSGALLFIYSTALGTIVLFTSFLYLLVRLIAYGPIRTTTHDTIVLDAKVDSGFMETIRSIHSLKRNDHLINKENDWRNQYVNAINARVRLGNLSIGFETASNLLAGVSNIAVIYIAALMVIEKSMSLGMLYALLAYKNHFGSATSSLIDEVINYRMMGLHLNRIADILLSEPEQDSTPELTQVEKISGALTLSKVVFCYDKEDAPLIQNLDLTIEPGECIAIVGSSGSGKSTILKLMQGQLSPSSGQVLIDGRPLRGTGKASILHHTASLMQEDSLLSGNIVSNICMDDPVPDIERIQRVGNLTGIHDTILLLPMGYETPVGEMGTLLSSGQVQRILLARALYKNPTILFLDEGTAHLDQDSEFELMSKIKKLAITIIFVTHRQSLLRLADKVLLIKQGKTRLLAASAPLLN